jgi:hypothetical protein
VGQTKKEGLLPALAPTPSQARLSNWFLVWTGGFVAAAGFLVLGTLVLIPVAILVLLISRRPAIRRSAFGASAGMGLAAVVVAFSIARAPARHAGTPRWHLDVINMAVLGTGWLSGSS